MCVFGGLRVLLRGPDASPDAGKWWLLALDFPKQYPASSPLAAFFHPIRHPNVGKEGKVGPWLDARCRPDTRVYELLLAVEDLLEHPKIECPAKKGHGQALMIG
jgi:ubiquitin-protein ligase